MGSRIRKFALVGLMALAAVGAIQGSASAAADGDLDISRMPQQAQWRINPGLVQVNPGSIQVNPGSIGAFGGSLHCVRLIQATVRNPKWKRQLVGGCHPR
jgi:hypothetical protein